MPLLAFSTFVAVAWTLGRSPKRAITVVLFASAVPALVWASWGMALRAKYHTFTTGYQLHWNLVDPRLRAAQAAVGMRALRDTRATYDAYMVSEAMPPGSPLWQAKVWRADVLRQIIQKEWMNVPAAGKEFLVLLTPGGLLALLLCIIQLTRERLTSPVRFRFASIVLSATLALVLAYCMLVFDGRYVIPMTPILMAVAVGAFLPTSRRETLRQHGWGILGSAKFWRTTASVILLVSLIGVQVYWASPFRRLNQDFQQSVYDGASALKGGSAKTVVLIGVGPYPEHGVGWEAGIYAAYFAGTRVIGDLVDLPSPGNLDSALADIGTLGPDAVMVWGTTSDPGYSSLINALQKTYLGSTSQIIRDPKRGAVGNVLILKNDRN